MIKLLNLNCLCGLFIPPKMDTKTPMDRIRSHLCLQMYNSMILCKKIAGELMTILLDFLLPVARVCLSDYVFYEHFIGLTGIFSFAKTRELHSVFYWINFENFCICWCFQIMISYCVHPVDKVLNFTVL